MSYNIIDEMIEKAVQARKELEHFSQEQVDRIIHEFALVVNQNAEMLAQMAVEETHMGRYEDKIRKNKGKSELIYNHLMDVRTVGVIARDDENGIIEIAEPVGTVAAIIPCTNPTVTAMSNSMFAIKGRNTIIIAPHPRAKCTTMKTVEMLVEVGRKVGLPENAVQVIEDPTKELSQELMSKCDFILATGGPAMVRAAYSSGKPSYGVGAGNVPAVIHPSANIPQAINDILRSKTFDNGLICSSEQAIITTLDIYDQVWNELIHQGAYIVSIPEKIRLRYAMFTDEDTVAPNVIGQPVETIAALARIELPKDRETKMLVVTSEAVGQGYPFSGEKMSPVITLFVTKDFNEAVERARQVLEYQGMGHTAVIHCHDESAAIQYALTVKASRILVNQPSALSSGGSRFNMLTPTTTLGCGSWGGNSTSDNITATHLINVKRLAFKLKEERVTEPLTALSMS